ncbi:MAG TPA: phage holin family protein [Methylomirabilota bacterium]|nr:phage holin family protein [Methylomirabilota bacterium]
MATIVQRREPAETMSTRELIGDILGKASLLVQKGAELARAEIRADLESYLAMVKGGAIAVVCVLMGVNALLMALVLGLAVWIPAWLAALIIAAVLLVFGAVIGYISWRRRVMPLAVTLKTLKEGVQWTQERLA